MPDTQDIHVHTIKFGLDGIDDTVATLTAQLGDAATIAKEAAEGISRVDGEYKFVNKDLTEWYNKLKELGLAHNKTTTDVIIGMQNAAAATKTAATATEEYGARVKKTNEAVIFSEENKKRSFEDIGRLLEGEKFGLRQLASNFGLLGPELVIVGSAVAYIATQLTEYNEKSDETIRLQKELNEVLVKSAEKTAEATIDVEKMNNEFSRSDSVKDRKKALDDYNKTFGDIIGYADTFEKAEQRLKDHTPDYVKAMGFRAQADAAYGLQKEALAKSAKSQVEGEVSLFGQIRAGVALAFGSYADAAGKLKTSNDAIIKENDDAAASFGRIAQKAEDSFAAIKTAAGGGTGQTPKDLKTKKEHDNSIEEERRYIAESQKLLESAMQKEVTNENIKYDKIYSDLKKHHHSTEELTKQHLQNLADIQTKYDLIVEKAIKAEQDKAKKDGDAESAKFFAEQDKERAKIAADKLKDDERMKKDAAKYLSEQFSTSLLEIKTLKGHYDLKHKMLDADRLLADGAFARGEISTQEHNKKISEINAAGLEIKKQQAEQEKMIVNAATATLDTLSKIAGEKTEAGKDLAIASATIKAIQAGVNTFEGFTDQFPGPVGIALGAVAAAGVAFTLFEQVKKIESVKIPGGSGGGGSSASIGGGGFANAPSIPKKPTTTTLSNSSLDKINQNNNGGFIKAVVSEQEITSTQRRVASFNNGSSLH